MADYTQAEHVVRSSAAPLTLRITRNQDGGNAALCGDGLAKEEGCPTIPLRRWRGLAPFLGINCQTVCDQCAVFHKEGCFVRAIPLDLDMCKGNSVREKTVTAQYNPPEKNISRDVPRMEWLRGPGWADSHQNQTDCSSFATPVAVGRIEDC